MEPDQEINSHPEQHTPRWKKSLRFITALTLIILGGLGMAYTLQAYPEVFRSDITLAKTADIQPQEMLVVDFSQPVIADFYKEKIRVVPETDIEVTWSNNSQRLLVMPKTFWSPETRYQLIIPEGRNRMLGKIVQMTAEFTTIEFPKVTGFKPEKDAKDVIVDIEDPITVNFDKSTKGFFLKFTIDPFSEMTYQNNPEKTEFKLMPTGKFTEGSHYNIKVFAKYAEQSDENYKQIYQSSFNTLPPPPQNWEKDFTLRLEQAKKYTHPKIMIGKYIDINLTSQILTIFLDGKLLDSYMVSTGKRGMETPKGEFQTHNKSPRAWSKAYGLFMPYWMAVAPDGKFGIHELPEWPGGYKEGANHLGTPVSHGCIRLGVGPAQRVYDWADIGTKVVIY